MGRLKSGLLVCVAVAAAAPAAFAADMPLPAGAAPAYAPPPPARYDWTGVYLGIHVGGGFIQDTVTTTATTALQNNGTSNRIGTGGIIGGGQAGFNVQFNSIVLGVEGAWTDSGISGSQQTQSLQAGIATNSTDAPDWYATAAGRIGYAFNDVLLFAKGGGAWMNVKYTQQVVGGGVQSQQSMSDTRTGFVVGGGIEYAFTENLSAKLEYDYLDFGTRNYSFNTLSFSPGGGLVIPVGAFPVSIKSQTHMALFGANYRFNWGGR